MATNTDNERDMREDGMSRRMGNESTTAPFLRGGIERKSWAKRDTDRAGARKDKTLTAKPQGTS